MQRSSVIPVAHCKRADLMPASVTPMLAVLSNLPTDPQNFGFEYKWDGVRAICYWDGARLRLFSRNQLDISSNYPELHDLGRALGRRPVILDGEIVALASGTVPSFALLQRRMHVVRPGNTLIVNVPVTYLLFDVLHLRARSTLALPYRRRREMLEELTLKGSSWEVPPGHVGEGAAMLDAARRMNLEGVVAKRLDSIYQPGRRSPDWLKIKVVMEQEFVIGGWIPQRTAGPARVGSLLLGYYDCTRGRSKLRFAGGVGSGFSDATHALLSRQLSRRVRATSPFADPVPRAGAVFVEPTLVAQVEFRRWPAGALVQQAAFKGLRTDKSPQDVVKELPTGSGV